MSREQAISVECVIRQVGDKYFWASRDNVELGKVDSGAYITFMALNGSGYVRIVKPEGKPAASLMSPSEYHYDYVEHLLIGLRSVTYYGKSD